MRHGGRRPWSFRLPALIVLAAVTLAFAPAALAKTYVITAANETFQIEADGSIQATERLTFEFQGAYHGAYRLIPVAAGEMIDQVGVSDEEFPDSPTGSALLGSSGTPGTFGSMTTPQGWKQVACRGGQGRGVARRVRSTTCAAASIGVGRTAD
jgi:hypothetical protein